MKKKKVSRRVRESVSYVIFTLHFNQKLNTFCCRGKILHSLGLILITERRVFFFLSNTIENIHFPCLFVIFFSFHCTKSSTYSYPDYQCSCESRDELFFCLREKMGKHFVITAPLLNEHNMTEM